VKTIFLSRWILVAAMCAAVYSLQAAPRLDRYEGSRMSMGCLYAIDAYGSDAGRVRRAVESALDEVDRLDRLMSHYKEDSALSRLNREAATRPTAVDEELFDVLAASFRYSRETGGAFDITVGPLMKAWGFFRGDGRLPSTEAVAAARAVVGSHHVTLDPARHTVSFDSPGVVLDLGGIGKGYAVDRAVRILAAGGVTAALVSAGGSTVFGLGSPPDRRGWDVAVQDPIDASRTAMRVTLEDRALSVAGSSEKFFEVDGVMYSHIMDPRSAQPARGVLAVAVVTPTGLAGDALDNAFFVLGPDDSVPVVRRYPQTDAYFFLPAADRRWTRVNLHRGN
jgi:FAD:protein FMN transferase